jgi:hypothetical protein
MRTRNQGKPFVSAGHWNEETIFDYTNPANTDFRSSSVISTVGLTYPTLTSSITDVEPRPSPEVYIDPKTGRWRRFKSPTRVLLDIPDYKGLYLSQLRPVNPCHHVKRVTTFAKNIIVSHSRVNSAGNPLFERTDTRTQHFEDALQLIKRYGSGFDVDEILDGTHGSSGDFLGHDWFALADRFSEACDQYMPSQFLAQESLTEGAIFVDALKAVINPSRAVLYLLHAGKALGKKVRKLSLGRAVHQIAKSSANAHLTYSFGIRPAISDILDSLNAHQKVSKRLHYLRSSAGRYVPVRVKQENHSSYDPSPPGNPPDPSTSHSLQWVTTSKLSTARIGCWGRVREDLNMTSEWSAYLQYFGINKAFGVAWELIPFSFVIDWFTNAQERINSLTRFRTGGPFVEFRNLSSSLKLEQTDELFLVPGRDPSFGGLMIEPSSAKSIAKIRTIDYNRMSHIPDTSGVVDFTSLGLFHALTGGGLIIQRT